MIELVCYEKAHYKTWNAFNADSKNGIFLFDRDFMDYHADRFNDNSLLFYENGTLLALLPLNKKENILYSHQGLTFGGFITKDSMKQHKMLACLQLLQEYMQKQNIETLIYKALPYIYHKSPADEDLYALFACNAKLWRTDCSTTIMLPLAIPLPKGRKAQIARAKKEGIIIEESKDFTSFIALLNSVLQARHNTTAVHNASELELLQNRFPENILLYMAKKESEILAATLLFIYPHIVHTQYLAVNDKGREMGALDLLIKTLIDKYSATKTYFDFGISTEKNGLFLNEGLIAQKEGFGGRTIVHNFFELHASATQKATIQIAAQTAATMGGGGANSLSNSLYYRLLCFLLLSYYRIFLSLYFFAHKKRAKEIL